MRLEDLNADQLRDLAAGEPLTFPASEKCPMAVGDRIVLERATSLAFTEDELVAGHGVQVPMTEAEVLWIEVTEIRRTKRMLWRVLYRTVDYRPVWLKGGPPMPEGSRLRQRTWTPTEEHGLTGRFDVALDPEAEVVDSTYRNVIEMGARLREAERQDAETARKQARSAAESIKQIVVMGERHGVDMAPFLAQIQQAIAAAEAEIDEEEAA